MPTTTLERAAAYRALGDPTRLAIVDELARSDRSPSELGRTFAVAGNLLAHHLDVLEDVGLIERVVSEGDRRRRYLRLRTAAADALGLRWKESPGSVVFVCTRNSARSKLAEAMWRRRGFGAESAGTHPARDVHPLAAAAAADAGFELSASPPRIFEGPRDGQLVVAVCDRAHEELGADQPRWHWSIPDPVAVGHKAAFARTIAELDNRIRHWT